MKLHTIYRSAPGENRKSRPAFYSKDVALRSFVRALEAAPPGERVFVNDGALPAARVALMCELGRVIELSGVGNARSYRACIGVADIGPWDDQDIVYFAEEDYLYTDNAFPSLMSAVRARPDVDYFTLYDHPDYASRPEHLRYQRRNPDRFVAGGVEWISVRSTCLTYAARVGALRRDSWAHYLASRDSPPGDHAMWSTIVGAGSAFLVPRLLAAGSRLDLRGIVGAHARSARVRATAPRLFAARPGLATHLEEEFLAPARDWAALAELASR